MRAVCDIIYKNRSERTRRLLCPVCESIMKNQKLVKTVIIILAVVCVGLFALYAGIKLGKGDDTGLTGTNDASNAGYSSQNGYYDDSVIVEGNDSSYTISDNGTVEMDSIPNDSSSLETSGSDLP